MGLTYGSVEQNKQLIEMGIIKSYIQLLDSNKAYDIDLGMVALANF